MQTTIKDFIYDITNYDTIEDILNNEKYKDYKGSIFERLFDIFFKLGLCDKFNNKDYYHLLGNVNNGKLKKMISYKDYLKKLTISGKSTGIVDITLQNKKITLIYEFINYSNNRLSSYF